MGKKPNGPPPEFTHKILVERAFAWLAGTMRCFPVFAEKCCRATSEAPDAFGINSEGTVLVECKMSVQDFYADRRKPFRQNPDLGVGRLRFYMTPPGLLAPARMDTMPGWGLLEVRGQVIRVIRPSAEFKQDGDSVALLLRSAWLHGQCKTPPVITNPVEVAFG